MSRFADARATRTIDLGPCECPGEPHDNDWIEIRTDLAPGELQTLLSLDKDQAKAASQIAPMVTRWNLLGPDGEETEPDAQSLFWLNAASQKILGDEIAKVVRENLRLPNRRSAPSRASSRGSASPTPIRHRATGT